MTPTRPDEFSLIARHFAPLASANPGALGLLDDGGLLTPAAGEELAVTVDTLIAGVHFRDADPADLVARKLLRVNLSDLAAMGARPVAYLVAASLPQGFEESWIAGFAAGLAVDQAAFGVALLGGDTTATPGPLSLTLTAIGAVPAGKALTRGGARLGDHVYVSGSVGDAALGLAVLQGRLDVPEADAAALIGRFQLPEPRLSLAASLRDVATAAADISDGLVADLGHICTASGVAARVHADLVPLSPVTQRCLAAQTVGLEAILTGGDDYELVFTAPESAGDAVLGAAAGAGVAATRIGEISAGQGVAVVDAAGTELVLASEGYRHF